MDVEGDREVVALDGGEGFLPDSEGRFGEGTIVGVRIPHTAGTPHPRNRKIYQAAVPRHHPKLAGAGGGDDPHGTR